MDGTSKRTIQDVEKLGDRQIRGVYSACIRLLNLHDGIVRRAIIEKINADIDKNHRAGIISSPVEAED